MLPNIDPEWCNLTNKKTWSHLALAKNLSQNFG